MKTYCIADWVKISMSLLIAMSISVGIASCCFNPNERTKTLIVVR